MTFPNIFRDISEALRYFFNHKEKVRIFPLSYAVKVLGGCDPGAVFRSRHASGLGQTRSLNARRKPCIFFVFRLAVCIPQVFRIFACPFLPELIFIFYFNELILNVPFQSEVPG